MTPPARLTLTLAMVVAVLSGGGAAVAAGAPTATRTPGVSAADDAVVSSSAPSSVLDASASDAGPGTDEAVAAYWTADRLRSATDADIEAGPASTPAGTPDAATSTSPAIAPRDIAQPAGPTADGDEVIAVDAFEEHATSRSTGRVFFRSAADGKDYACSGSSLNARNRSVVLTAGHCVHGGAGRTWHRNWVFIPGYEDGRAPFGIFPYQRLHALHSWTQDGGPGDVAWDIGMATMHPNAAGTRLGDAVGGDGLTIGRSLQGVGVEILGYPGNRSDGQRLSACRSTASQEGSEVRADSCGFGHGASGGPWLDRFDPSTGRGFARSVTSEGTDAVLFGPTLGPPAEALFRAAESAP